jgi:CRISPR-associated protein Csy3
LIGDGLAGNSHVLLQVTAYVRVGAGQEVFPSQELILDKGRSDKSKTLYEVDGTAGLHSQKVGNAIRTIDTWYPEVDELGPIAVEPYGSVTTRGKAYRQPARATTLLPARQLDHQGQEPATEQQHFVIATLIRGGVFGEAG